MNTDDGRYRTYIAGCISVEADSGGYRSWIPVTIYFGGNGTILDLTVEDGEYGCDDIDIVRDYTDVAKRRSTHIDFAASNAHMFKSWPYQMNNLELDPYMVCHFLEEYW